MTIELATEFFMWGFILNALFTVLMVVMIPIMRPIAHKIHSRMFGVTPKAIDQFIYGYLALQKVLTGVFFLAPWLALLIMA